MTAWCELDSQRAMAQRDANLHGTIALLNLNRVGAPMYVRRLVTKELEAQLPAMLADKRCVGVFEPQPAD